MSSLADLVLAHPVAFGLPVVLLPFVYAIYAAVYNIYFHPLARFPGPKYAVASQLWYCLALTRGTAPMDMLALHERYGPVVRVAPDELSYSSAEATKTIYGHGRKAGESELAKDPKYHVGLSAVPLILNADSEHHAVLRKALSHSFSNAALQAQESVLQDNVRLLVGRFREDGKEGGVALDLRNWYNYFTFDVMGNLTYGEPLGCLQESRLHTWVNLNFYLIKQAIYAQACARLPEFLQRPYAMYYLSEDITSKVKVFDAIAEAKVRRRMENPSPFPDLMAKLLDAYESVTAGSEITATLLAGATYLLMTNPGPLLRLTREIRSTFSSQKEITMVALNRCRYLHAVLEEALRVYPPAPDSHPRFTPPEGIIIDGRFVPGNVVVGVTILAATKSSANFVDPDKFLPERWMNEDPRFDADNREALQPFSYGTRDCIGRTLAYAEMKLVIANLLWHFDLENCTPGNWMDQLVHVVWMKQPLMVKLHPVRG